MVEPYLHLNGRRMILTDETEVNIGNVVQILRKALPYHWKNRSEISYLWSYYKGRQPILNRVKEVRPEITNKIVENRANEIVSFKSGYLMGEPLQYVSRGNAENIADAINQLNEFVFAEEKPAKDKELADWFHICGTSFRMVLPDEMAGEDDESPFEIYTLDPRNTFVVYNNGLGNNPILGVKYVVDENGVVHYSCYSDREYFEIVESKVVSYDTHILGEIPIIEYPLNMARIGAFELVIPLLDAINLTDSNRLDGVEQFIQALMLFHNVDISSEDFDELRERGAIKFKDIDPQLKAEINYLVSNLNQGETQTLVDHMYQTVLTICGMPNRNGGSSTSDTGSAVIMRDGWSAAEARAKDSELMFKKSERIFLKVVLNICRTLADMDLKVCNVEIRFTRRNYENILQKAQVLDLMLKNNKIHPRLAFEHCGLFVDSDLAYTLSAEYAEEQEQKAQELFEQQQRMKQEGNDDDSGNNEGNGGADGKSAETREQSGNTD
ncbi:phage portal protein [Mediterraneibacter faecis]|uniref:phage portal protein n=1 Tax=Mediterraneibacter faecis TaxID=592978 RepID=UPI001D071D92|nr:phage portal protein [Mediterraneibacter faecis]MCB7327209.1 phage portal protein [Mediterraneibacter faecis]